MKENVHSKSVYDTVCELQESKLQLIERDDGIVTW
jgi:hypothetical protein